jgi:hypothetical protein
MVSWRHFARKVATLRSVQRVTAESQCFSLLLLTAVGLFWSLERTSPAFKGTMKQPRMYSTVKHEKTGKSYNSNIRKKSKSLLDVSTYLDQDKSFKGKSFI